jgi:hypothetical protein
MNRRSLLLSTIFILFTTIAYSQVIVGNDRDKHGCIGSAGYTYSAIKNNCIQVFEQKIKLQEVDSSKTSTFMAAVIFSKDYKKAEVFLHGYKEGQILIRTGKKGNYSWKKDDLELTYKKVLKLTKAKKLIYAS